MHPLRRSTPGRCSRLTNPTGSPFRTFRCLLLLGTLRIGEAINPGPTLGDHHLSMEGHWLLSANPTGAAHKAHIYLQPRVTWCLQERHLTSRGTAAFLREVQAQAKHVTPDHRWRYHSGHPCPPRRDNAQVGKHMGVGFLSACPIRPLPGLLAQEAQTTSRITAAALLLGPHWVEGITLYGYTPGYSHQYPLQWTQHLLAEAVTAILTLGRGPRFLSGDFNYSISELPALQVLLDQGWQEAQDLAMERWGRSPQPTWKAVTRRDHILLSPELCYLVRDVQLLPQLFPDHTALAVQLAADPLPQWHWPQPLPLPWTQQCHMDDGVRFTPVADHVRMSTDYLRHCRAMEDGFQSCDSRCKGRGATVTPQRRCPMAPARTHPNTPPEGLRQGQYLEGVYLQLRRVDALCEQLQGQAPQSPAWHDRLLAQWFHNGSCPITALRQRCWHHRPAHQTFRMPDTYNSVYGRSIANKPPRTATLVSRRAKHSTTNVPPWSSKSSAARPGPR